MSVSKSLDPDQAQHFDGADLDQNCLHMLFAVDKLWLAGKEMDDHRWYK